MTNIRSLQRLLRDGVDTDPVEPLPAQVAKPTRVRAVTIYTSTALLALVWGVDTIAIFLIVLAILTRNKP
jgi:hypothetical protein